MEHNQCRSLFHFPGADDHKLIRTQFFRRCESTAPIPIFFVALLSDFQHELWITMFMMRASARRA